MKIAVVGATGLVGSKMLQLLEERNFPLTQLIPVASEKSVGKILRWKGNTYPLCTHQQALAEKPHIALFSAGGNTSLEWAPQYAEQGCVVIDNSSAWRMDATKKLIVPEINAHVLTVDDKIIANPNCSTIQMLMVLKPLHDRFTVKRVVVSTYQSVSGTGKKAVDQLMNERQNIKGEMAYPYPIDLNLIPHIDSFTENGYTKEEMKMLNETRKIMGDSSILLSATTVRVPVSAGHSESVNIEFEQSPDLEQIHQLLNNFPGVKVIDSPLNNEYPMPLIHAQDSDLVFVGRIRKDLSHPKAINCWIVSDNLRKGAATNAIQIAEYLIKEKLVSS
ncbi:MAG TPA: aspartate-semialdehyde dehydrogenase [Bacteroidia bacterium]|nr:aspartate-semialdehyde dehydrogenase [Bacteroidia bacterium]HNT80965.1 aspartate-semialdehyde dehydrogenase [Bacteroidia bacterium]